MSTHSRDNASSDTASARSKTPNFSRPQPPSALKSGQKKHSDRHVHIIDAFHEPSRAMPSEPRFSGESERTDQTSSENSTGSEFAWDGHAGEIDSQHRKKRYDSQRYVARDKTGRPGTPGTARSNSTGGSSVETYDLYPPSTASGSNAHIVKRVSVDQRSERIPAPADPTEDSGSHHTVSESGDSGSFDVEGRWQSSDYDTSQLSAAEIRKLEKKGINPALYVEMNQAKKGKKWMPHLLGNGFIN